MKLTTGYEFQGYFITEYYDVIFDEMLVGLGLGKSIASSFDNLFSALSGSEATTMVEKLNAVKRELRDRVIKKAKNLGANALIGIDFESSKLGDMIMVSMTATAVKIDKVISPLPCTSAQKAKEEADAYEQQKVAEEKQRWERAKKEGFEFESFIKILREYETVREMYAYVERMVAEQPNVFSEECMQKLKKSLMAEKVYGKSVGKSSFIETIQEYFGK